MSHHSSDQSSSLFIPVCASCFGTLVLLSYAFSFYQIRFTPHLFDKDAIWGLLYEKNWKPNYFSWFIFLVGEFLSVVGFLIATVWLWNEHVSDALGFFYILFLVSEAMWMPLAIRGLEFYSATLMVLVMAAIASCGLFVITLQMWGTDKPEGFVLFPLFLHCTFFDMIAWGYSFDLRSVHDRNRTLQILEQEPVIFTVTEEDHDEGTGTRSMNKH